MSLCASLFSAQNRRQRTTASNKSGKFCSCSWIRRRGLSMVEPKSKASRPKPERRNSGSEESGNCLSHRLRNRLARCFVSSSPASRQANHRTESRSAAGENLVKFLLSHDRIISGISLPKNHRCISLCCAVSGPIDTTTKCCLCITQRRARAESRKTLLQFFQFSSAFGRVQNTETQTQRVRHYDMDSAP